MNGALTVAQGLSGKLRGGGGLNRRRVCACAAILLCLELAGLAFCVAGTHGWIVPLKGPVSTDFVSFYAAGRLADEGTPALVYEPTAHHAAEQAATEPGIAYNFFYYPPVFILLCAIFARLPYLAAFMAFQAATLLPCLLVARRILSESGWASLLPLLAFPAVYRHRTERLPHRRTVRRGNPAGGWPPGAGRHAVRRALLQAAFRPARASRTCRWRSMEVLRGGGDDGRGADRGIGADIRPWHLARVLCSGRGRAPHL